MIRASLYSAAAFIAFAGAAFAEDIEQVTLGSSFGALHLHVDDVQEAGGSAIAAGNIANVSGGHVNGSSRQEMRGDATAISDAQVWNADGAVVTGAFATGNGGTVETHGGDQTIEAVQITGGHSDIEAHARSTTGNTGALATSATAGANVAASSAVYGDLNARVRQTSGADVRASVEADACCVSGAAVADSLANANSVNAAGSTTTMIVSADQTSTGRDVSARTDLYVGYAYDAVGGATAAANSVTLDNEWGYLNASIRQRNASNTQAEAYVTLGGDWLGTSSATAYGVGNAAAVTNVGSDTVAAFDQANAGDVNAFAALSGAGGAYGLASATAVGNSASASLCHACGDATLSTPTNQANDGNIAATATVISSRAGNAYGTASAIGNAATFVTREDY